jgi:hypothetical protein
MQNFVGGAGIVFQDDRTEIQRKIQVHHPIIVYLVLIFNLYNFILEITSYYVKNLHDAHSILFYQITRPHILLMRAFAMLALLGFITLSKIYVRLWSKYVIKFVKYYRVP